MLALTSNWIDWVLAILIGIPLLVVAVCWLVVAADERCPCGACCEARSRARHPAGRDL